MPYDTAPRHAIDVNTYADEAATIARLTADDVDFKRPGTGIQPDELRYALQRPLARDVEAEDELDWTDLG